ncbi:ribosome maturation factor RimM [Schnuerera sp.]|uniref:ribosome maturation factor RimM n=1 Tax=Schnuerera sp. TaxID=2794844 RepID=UPI002C9023EE|nr:ribosome maturation factor RimM [Schnuerera sp.]HSH35880.1 ribosome maturation factor RimM [Schnuerera sp.]
MGYIKVGWIMNTHGIKGELKVYPLTDDVNRFSSLNIIYIGENKYKAEVEKVKYINGLAILKLKEFNNINDVLRYKEAYIYIDEDDKVKLPKNHFFIFDIIDCTVYNTEEEKIGIVTDVMKYASNDVYVVKNNEKNKEYLIPAVKEFVVSIDILSKKIVIDPIEGMIV